VFGAEADQQVDPRGSAIEEVDLSVSVLGLTRGIIDLRFVDGPDGRR
jgi:hypothetical protein